MTEMLTERGRDLDRDRGLVRRREVPEFVPENARDDVREVHPTLFQARNLM